MPINESHLGGCIRNTPNEGDGGTWAPEIWDKIIKDFNIISVLDIGCGYGYSTRYFANKNILALGIEGWPEAIKDRIYYNVLKHDYINGPALSKDKIFNFDLIWCCEFVEHVEEKYSDNFLQDFSGAKYVAMTHAMPNQPGHHHVNCQNKEYWIDKLKKINFLFNEEYTEELKKLAIKISTTGTIPHGSHTQHILFFKHNDL